VVEVDGPVGLSGMFGAGEGGEGEGVEGCPLSAEGGGRGEIDGHGGAVMGIMKDTGCKDSVLCTERWRLSPICTVIRRAASQSYLHAGCCALSLSSTDEGSQQHPCGLRR